MSRTTYEVTQVEIDRGLRNNSSRCAVAQTLIRLIPEAKRVEVDMQTIRWTQNGERIVFITPYAVQDYLIAFDAGDELQPFKFKLDSEQRMTSPLLKRNKAAQKIDGAGSKVSYRKRRVQELEQKVTEAKAEHKPPTQVKAVQAQVKAAKVAVQEAQQELMEVQKAEGAEAERTFDNATTDRPRPVKRVGTTNRKTSTRYFGRRMMRVNQERHEAEVAEANERIRTHRGTRKAAAKKTTAAKKSVSK